MEIKKNTINKTFCNFLIATSILPVNAMANNIPPGMTMSGELLQNNPMLNVPSAPQSKGLNELPDQPVEKSKKEKKDSKRGPELHVSNIRVDDAPKSADKIIKKFVEQYHDKNMTIAELREVAMDITSILQQYGERLSYAYVPNQKIENGTVIIKIMTGHLENISLHKNASLIKNFSIEKYVQRIKKSKSGITDIESQLLYLSDLPGVGEVSPFLSAGKEKGGSVLNLDLTPSSRIDGVVVFDNTGSISSGRNRIGTQININSPLGFGDRLQALAYYSPDFIQINKDSKHGNTIISRLSYDAPVTTGGSRAGLSYSRVNYKLGGPYLHGLGDGFAEVASLYSSHSLIRSSGSNMTLGLNFDLKRMNDKFWDESNSRSSSIISAQISGYIPKILWNGNNILQYQFSTTAGRLNNSDDWNGLSTKGDFYKANQELKFQQGLMPGVAFNLALNAQQASKNLDGAEKMSLGGPYAVRAYSNSSASADSAWIVSPGFSFRIPGFNGMTGQIFYDYASGKVQKFSRYPSKVKLRGYGVGLSYEFNSKLFINASYAWRDGKDELLSSQNKAMGWINAGYRF
ncbi:ShlB/FhaC/HecB family hemolysin secretion/activation protein [Erwinia sorbitola]|uniref:Heme/hemopexin transporter protein HuxB n=1 Tax=Erwinia sorbitola TaxID=2681984 RepID=A0ABW9RAG8_9GAMM|nr:ShlB/FhaC/HecB family hemolysin secretion/activation protein [Erwinia sorbitola]MTD26982.1 hypothetical protein [Erwinia sorbitola]